MNARASEAAARRAQPQKGRISEFNIRGSGFGPFGWFGPSAGADFGPFITYALFMFEVAGHRGICVTCAVTDFSMGTEKEIYDGLDSN